MTVVTAHVTEHLRPILELRETLAERWTLGVDAARARSRLAGGRVAFDPLEVLGAAGDLVVPFLHVTAAFERCGLATSEEGVRVRRHGFHVLPLLVSWLSDEPLPVDHIRRLGRLAAAVLGNSILSRAAAEVRAGLEVEEWSRPDCPCCGGAPEFVRREGHQRRLLCARCDTSWPANRGECAGCGASTEPTIARVVASDLGYVLTICNDCGRYLKERIEGPLAHPLLERLVTTELDAAAQHRGLHL